MQAAFFLTASLPKLLTDKVDLSLVMTGRHLDKELSALLIKEPLFTVEHGVAASPDHPVFASGADLKHVFSASEWLSTAQDEAFLLEELAKRGIARPRTLTLCDFYSVDALKDRNNALSAFRR